MTTLFTSELVSRGHPDKLCDQISDSILDACLREDPNSRVAVETAIKSNTVMVLGELTSRADLDIDGLVRQALLEVHPDERWGVDAKSIEIIERLSQQSTEISSGVHREDIGAGDQGLMFGFATDATPTMMPVPFFLCQQLMLAYEALREQVPGLGADAKVQVTVRFDGRSAISVEAVVFSAQHGYDLSVVQVREILEGMITEQVSKAGFSRPESLLLNPAGNFHIGGPVADAGVTGRKIIADSYGGWARHGGGAFSGKDGTKVDRSGAYGARQLACDVVSRGWARDCEVGVSYAIGAHRPVHLDFVTDTGVDVMAMYRGAGIDVLSLLTPQSLMDRFFLTSPVFSPASYGGHFGRGFAWDMPLVQKSGSV